MLLHHLQFMIDNFAVRQESLEGKEYYVAPVIMLTEGVHNGSTGPLFYPAAEIKKSAKSWNGVPVTLPHPTTEDGVPVSANSPEMIDAFRVGQIFNSNYSDGKLKAEAWLDIEKLAALGKVGIVDNIKKNQKMEVSTGLFSDEDDSPGKWNEEDYIAAVSNFRPDHLALLPDTVGACSWEDGCGIRDNFSNTRSLDQTMNSIYQIFSAKSTDAIGYYVLEVYKDHLIYEKYKRKSADAPVLYKQNYSIDKNNVAELTGQPQEVKRQVKYVTVNIKQQEEGKMSKKKTNDKCCPEKVQLLIENESTPFEETDRDWLESMTEEQIDKLAPKTNEGEGGDNSDGNEGTRSSSEDIQNAANKGAGEGDNNSEEGVPITDIQQNQNTQTPQTVEQYIQNAPVEMQGVLNEGLAMHRQQKKALIDGLLANQNNSFTKEQLEAKDLGELKSLAQLAGTSTQNYKGQGGAIPRNNDDSTTVEPLDMPVMNFGSE